MERFTRIIIAVAAVVLAVACTTKSTAPTKTAVGDAYQVMIICPNDVWQGDLSMAVCDALEEDAEGLTRPQGYFDIVQQKAPELATDIDRKYANLLIISILPGESECEVSVSRNVYARPQTVVSLVAPTVEAATEYVREEAAVLREYFEVAERNRSISYSRERVADQLVEDFAENVGYSMIIPTGFTKATTRDESLLWYLRDYPTKAQYIFAFDSEYTDELDLTGEWLMMSLDNKLSTISSRGAAGSHMGVNQNDPYYTKMVEINGREWVELRGHWEVTNDFMGGPFVCYSTLNPTTGRITNIMFAIYAPEEPQRNLLREIEHMIYSIE